MKDTKNIFHLDFWTNGINQDKEFYASSKEADRAVLPTNSWMAEE